MQRGRGQIVWGRGRIIWPRGHTGLEALTSLAITNQRSKVLVCNGWIYFTYCWSQSSLFIYQQSVRCWNNYMWVCKNTFEGTLVVWHMALLTVCVMMLLCRWCVPSVYWIIPSPTRRKLRLVRSSFRRSKSAGSLVIFLYSYNYIIIFAV